MVKCPYCGYEGNFRLIKQWRFRFYIVKELECPKCHGVFNHYYGVNTQSNKVSEFVIRVKPKSR
ncbi:hypothetical protein [Caldivirga maquilingensis]|nr:hypothetical protein [Caldivirga maquilingensis]